MRVLFCLFVAVATCCSWSAPANAQITGLKSRVPSDANAVVVIDINKLFGSRASEQGRWEARRQAAFDAGVTYVSPNVTGVVVAANMDLEYGRSVWELSQVRVDQDANLANIVSRYGGELDTIASRPAVRLPNDSIVVQVTKDRLASYTPANRQEVARWLNATDVSSTDDGLSSYISQAFSYVEKVGTPIILAVDLHGAISPKQVERRLADSQAADSPVADFTAEQKAAVVETLSSIQGAMLGVTVNGPIVGSIRVDFAKPVAPIESVGKQMLLNVLERQGAMLPEFADWEVRFTENTMLLKGNLSESSLRHALSVLALPPSLGQAMDQMKLTGADDAESKQRVASQQYFNSVTGLLDDLQKTRRNAKSVTPGGLAMWYQKTARKIDHLPMLNVDDALLDYGRDVSTLLRGGETALKGVGMRSSIRTGQNNTGAPAAAGYTDGYAYNNGYGTGYGGYRSGYGYNYGYGGYGEGAVNAANMANREKGRTDAIIRRQERTMGAAQAQQMWQAIDAETADVRRDMTQKYNVEF